MFFHVADPSGVVWRLYPRRKGVTLDDISTIKYGEVPSNCYQEALSNSTTPPTLVEGTPYYAVAAIFDSDAVRLRFTIRDGKVIRLPDEIR
jgi:hypothetical protein